MSNELDGIIRFMQSPIGRMIINGGKDFFTNHLFPYMRQNFQGSMKPVDMPEAEQQARAKDEFMTVSDFDLEMPGSQPEPPAPNQKPDDKDKGKT
ncbi:hypothetical protein [Serratia fonticola]|uniref:hypothetical protein n=1 Tax=Serratia fonticola TaxID=47917 RepID=UPI0034C66F9E